MFRYVIVPVLMALLLVPDWASALGRNRPLIARRAQATSHCYPVQYSQPVYYSPPPVQYYPATGCSPCCPSAPAVAPAKPMVVPERMEPKPVVPKSNVQSEPLAQPRAVEPDPSFKPAVGTETLPAMKDPIPVVPVAPKLKEPALIPIIPSEKPKDVEVPSLPPLKFEPKKTDELPKLELTPKKPDELPKLELPKLDLVPKVEEPKLDVPSIPTLEPLPMPKTSKSSPLNAEPAKLKIDRFAVEGTAPESPDSLRVVTFYNFSGADLTLTLAGRAVVVPAKHSVEAKLPAKFTWQIGDAVQAEGNIPLTAPGMDVVIGK